MQCYKYMHTYIFWYKEDTVLLIIEFFDVTQVAILTSSSLIFSCSLQFPVVTLKNPFLIIFLLYLVTELLCGI